MTHKTTVGDAMAYPEGYPDDFQADLERQEKRVTQTAKHVPDPFPCWLWPDRSLSAAESRQMRSEHNRVCDIAADLLAACEAHIREWHSNNRNFERAEPESLKLARAAIAKA